MKIAVVGATGLVGREILTVLEEHRMIREELIPVASERSAGTTLSIAGKEYRVHNHTEAIGKKPAVAIFSAGSAASKEWAPRYAENGITVIDNSSAWRMDPGIPLIVPEINAHILKKEDRIIANPNCSTIELVLVLAPLHRRYRIRRVVMATYQSVTGTGIKAVRQLENERRGIKGEMAYPHPIDLNLLPHGGTFLPDGYTTEEVKLVNETRKILDDPSILLTATIVRVPVTGGHSEAVNIELEAEYDIREIYNILGSAPGVTIQDDPSHNIYPMPLYSRGKDDVFVGRIRRDDTQPFSLNLFIVSDNLRKGAATNAVQIAEYLSGNNLL
jgi:aspartate-semialdehyde dehydrogenase